MPSNEAPGRAPDIAIIGMAGHFPKAATVADLWKNLRAGVEALSTFEYSELIEAGVDPSLAGDPNYVPVAGALDGAEMFSASFFGYAPREALTMDPQQRHFLECAWEALENAGYGDPPSATGVFGGVSVSTYLLNRLIRRPDLLEGPTEIETTIGTDKDFLASRVAYKLDLRGPAVVVQSACSSSLLAVHLGCRALQAGDCELALAGGTSIDVPQHAGYLFKPDGIYASDGHCRPFDARADGMVGGSGVGVVVLKPLEAAMRDRDHIDAVILGSAINNDGADKVGYSAPSVEAQAEVIAAALRSADVDPETIEFVEAHGTGTTLGDPIEVVALTQAFATSKRRYCALGAIKSNLGHLNAAAGITGLIKAVLTVREGEIPATLHFEVPNPHLRLDDTPFYVNNELIEWPSSDRPRRAGVSSFGMGGTNAHLVIEQPPERPATDRGPDDRAQVLVLSARTASALEASRRRLASALDDTPALDLRDVAFTLQVGRKPFDLRAAVVCRTLEEASRQLSSDNSLITGSVTESNPEIAFLLPGQGAQHPGMASPLYESQPAFRATFDRCSKLFEPELSIDLRQLLFADGVDGKIAARLTQTEIAQSALFAVQYALSELWRAVGVEPDALIGHSIGEYTAASIAGVLSLGDAISLVAARGRLLQELPAGSMLAVQLGEGDIAAHVTDEVVVAAINDPGTTVVSGPSAAIESLERKLRSNGILSQPLHTSHAFHSPMMRPAAEALRETVARLTLSEPTIPFVSNVTGTWITNEQATDPAYWAEHLMRPVRFMDGLTAVVERGIGVLLEVGPGTTLATLARRHPLRQQAKTVVSTLPHARDRRDIGHSFQQAAATLWTVGVDLRWDLMDPAAAPGRVPLPSYPFERQRFWVDALPRQQNVSSEPMATQRLPADGWCSIPSWRRVARPPLPFGPPDRPVVVLATDGFIAAGLRKAWGDAGRLFEVRPGSSYTGSDEGTYEIDPWNEEHYERLLAEIGAPSALTLIHTWAGESCHQDRGFDSLFLAARAVGHLVDRVDWLILTGSIHEVTGAETIDPSQATVLGPCRVIPLEYEGHRCRNVDLSEALGAAPADQVVEIIQRELSLDDGATTVAYRGGHRWLPAHSALDLPPASAATSPLADGLRCVVTGGFSGVGAAIAAAIAERCKARIALLARTSLPPRQAWDELCNSPSTDTGSGRAIATVLRLEALGSEVLPLAADVADRESLAQALETLRGELGGLDLVVHAAGLPGGGAIELKSLRQAHTVLAAKVGGTQNLWDLTRRDSPRDFVLCSSLAAELGGFGQIDYCAANAFQDVFATAHQSGTRLLAIDWDTWSETGMAVDTEVPTELRAERDAALGLGLRTEEAQQLFVDMLASEETRILVSTQSLAPRLAAAARPQSSAPEPVGAELSSPRPETSTDYRAPGNDLERQIAEHWRRLFGLDTVGADDDFFELGGHSLLATQLLNRLRKSHPNAVLSLATLFEHPTIAALAALIAASKEPASATPTGAELAGLPSADRRDFFESYISDRLEAAEAGPSNAIDIEAFAPQLVWDLRRDLHLSVYPHELRRAGSVADLTSALEAIIDGSPSPFAEATRTPGKSLLKPQHDVAKVAKNESMVFLISAPRSGSTLLRLMLAGHPGLFCPPELALLSATDMGEWRAQQHGIFARDGLTRALMELRELSESEARATIEEMVAAHRPVQDVYRDLQADLGDRVLVDKSPAYSLDTTILLQAERLFDKPRYILLTRHPLAVVESLLRHRMEVLLSAEPIDDPWTFAESVWTTCNQNLLELEAEFGDRCHRLRYEDLVREPEGAMRGLADFLGISYEESLVSPYAGGRMIDGPGDPDIFQHDAIEASLADAWRSVEPPGPLSDETLELARRLGYAVPRSAPTSPASSTGPAEADDMLAHLDELSDDEVARALDALLGEDPAES